MNAHQHPRIEYTGIVLAGGKSSRMGFDKCFVEHKGITLVQNSINVLKKVSDKIILSSNSNKFNDFGFPIVKDKYKNCGALGGLHSSLQYSETKMNVFIPCDMPYVVPDLYQYLIEKNNADFDAIVPVFNGKVEPLTCLINKRILPIIENQIISETYKILLLFKKVNTKFVEINNNVYFYSEKLFLNVNSPDDLQKIN